MKWETKLTELLGIQYPIIQGGLAYLAYSELASAVSHAGGLGQITAMTLASPRLLQEEINHLKKQTNKPFGVNFAIGQHGRPYEDYLEIAIQEEVPVITVTGGNPAPVFKKLQGTKSKKLVLVSSKRQAIKAEALGADAVIVVGQEGGGHIGKDDIGTMVLVPSVVEAVSIPVIASGGITDGRGLMAALALGAEGIEMGTRFIATKECVNAHDQYKKKLIDASVEDTLVIKRSLGAPGRTLRNPWTEKIITIEKNNGGYEELKHYISGKANTRYIYEGDEENGFGWAGQSAGNIHEIVAVNDLFSNMIHQSEAIRKRWA